MSESIVLRSHLEREVKRLHGERRNGTIFGALLVLVVCGYMFWLDAQATYWSRPDNLALTSAGVVEAYLPSAKRAAADTIRREAPALARYVGDSVSAEVPRLVREMVASMVTEYADRLADFATTKYVDAFSALIVEAKGDIKQALDTDVNQDQEALVVKAIEAQFQAMGKRVEDGDLGGDPLFVQIEKSHQALANLNARLRKLVAQDDAKTSRHDKLSKRFLGTFWRFVQQENPDVKASDDPDAAKAAAPK